MNPYQCQAMRKNNVKAFIKFIALEFCNLVENYFLSIEKMKGKVSNLIKT